MTPKAIANQPDPGAAPDDPASVSAAIAVVEARCAERRLKLTPIRRRVLEMLLERPQAMGAYDILARLQAEGLGAHPPAAYRALDFLTSNGFAHKLERLNAFVACDCPDAVHQPAFLICRSCMKVSESDADAVADALNGAAAAAGFQIEATAVEAEGLCPDCREAPRP